MKFAHMGDCHLGGWRHPELKELNFKSFQYAVDKCIKEKVGLVLITGDLFDSAYPPIETLRDVFYEFRKLEQAKIPVFLIAGSHDYSASGKTFLDVLSNAGFCKNVYNYEERDNKIMLLPTVYENVAIYGYPGKKSGLEVGDIERIKLQDAPGLFKILMLHTAIRDAVGKLPIEAVDQDKLPKVDYLALGHLHIRYHRNNRVYCGPTFPNTLSELEELKSGSFYIVNTNGKAERQEIKLKDVIAIEIEINDALRATEKILSALENQELKDRIVILKLHGIMEKGKTADIDFRRIEEFVKSKNAYVLLRSTTKLFMQESDIKISIAATANLEEEIIRKFQESNPNKFNLFVPELIRILQVDKLDDEKIAVFEERIMSEARKVLNI